MEFENIWQRKGFSLIHRDHTQTVLIILSIDSKVWSSLLKEFCVAKNHALCTSVPMTIIFGKVNFSYRVFPMINKVNYRI